jgi:hypothetical protein
MTKETKQNNKEKSLKNGDEKGRDPVTGRFVEGYKGGPGRSQGVRDWSTDWDAFIKEKAKETGKSVSEVRIGLLRIAYKMAVEKGDSRLLIYLFDREYGKMSQPFEGDISIAGAKELADKLQDILDEPESKKGNKGIS